MPNVWQSVDTNFPTLSGNFSAAEVIPKLLNYMHILTEQLKYTLANLDKSNWNKTALNEYTEESAAPMLEAVGKLEVQVNTLRQSVSGLGLRMGYAESDIEDIQGVITDMELTVETLEGSVEDILYKLQALESFIEADAESGTVTIGESGQAVYLDGQVYINGRLQ